LAVDVKDEMITENNTEVDAAEKEITDAVETEVDLNEGSDEYEASEDNDLTSEAEQVCSEDNSRSENVEFNDENSTSDDSEASEQEVPLDEKSEKSGFFKKKDKKDKRDEQIADLTDKLKRSMAEFENFRKRTDKEKSQMYEIGASDVIGKILPVIDNFERGLSTITEAQKDDPIASGMELIYKQLMTALTDMGVTQIPALNEQFDPNLHNAVMHVDDETVGENVIVEEFQKGYKYRDSIVRHSMVKVAN